MNDSHVHRLMSLPLIEAGLAMIAASALVRTARFAHIARTAAGRPQLRGRAGDAAESRRIARAIVAWARRLPWRTLCFEQGLAATWMLRRRGYPATLYYGVAPIDGELAAHVWVRSGAIDVIGCENAGDYAILARFPPSD